MKYFSLWLLLTAISFSIHGQQFNYNQITVHSIDSLQSHDDAYNIQPDFQISPSGDYFPGRKNFSLAQPIIYMKRVKKFMNQTFYYFSEPDSIVRLIEYAWEGSKEVKESEFFRIVEKNKQTVSKYFNNTGVDTPASGGKAAKTVWENEAVYVQQFFVPGLKRIRVLVSWK